MYGSGRSEPLPPPRAPLGVMSGLVLQGDATVVHSAPGLQEGLSRTGKESLRINKFNKFNMLQTTEPSPLYCIRGFSAPPLDQFCLGDFLVNFPKIMSIFGEDSVPALRPTSVGNLNLTARKCWEFQICLGNLQGDKSSEREFQIWL